MNYPLQKNTAIFVRTTEGVWCGFLDNLTLKNLTIKPISPTFTNPIRLPSSQITEVFEVEPSSISYGAKVLVVRSPYQQDPWFIKTFVGFLIKSEDQYTTLAGYLPYDGEPEHKKRITHGRYEHFVLRKGQLC